MTPAQIEQAVSLLTQLTQLKARKSNFEQAVTFQIDAIGPAGVLDSTSFPAATYISQLDAAFDAQISAVTSQLTALGVTGI